VRFASPEDAQAAIERFNGFQVQGSFEPLEVRVDNKA
jgi:RNA recognition motif-containing protein